MLAPETPGAHGGSAFRVRSLAGSPTAIRWVIPLLVALTGLLMGLVGHGSLRVSSEDLTRQRFQEETRIVAESVGEALRDADPLMAHIVEYLIATGVEVSPLTDPTLSSPVGDLAHELAAAVRAHEGVVYASVSLPSGMFYGSFIDEDGGLRFEVECGPSTNLSDLPKDAKVITKPGTRVVYDLLNPNALKKRNERPTTYDPRTRPFYISAVEKKGPVWTEPYLFYDSKLTGISRALPLYRAGKLVAVLTIDFDVHSLSTLVTNRQVTHGVSTLLHTDEGVLLAVPEALVPKDTSKSEHPLTYRDMGDPMFAAFFNKPAAGRQGWHDVSGRSGGEAVLALSSPVQKVEGISWTVTAFIPESVHGAIVRHYQVRSLIALGAALALSILIGSLVARYLHRARELLKAAEDLAQRAEVRAEKAEGLARQLGSYELVQCLGHGGMGEVWRATHRLLSRDAAIKVIRADYTNEAARTELQERFRREAQALAQLRSRSTVTILDYGVASDGSLFLVMELLDGFDLRRMVTAAGPMPVERVLYVMNQICASLSEAHALGIVHRDVKPANIFLAKAGDEVDLIKVLDFGLVHIQERTAEDRPVALRVEGKEPGATPVALGPSTPGADTSIDLTKGAWMGTPGYMAPEQVMGEKVTPATDVYALGCLMVYLLTGKMVFERSDIPSLLWAHVSDPVPAFDSWTAHTIPPALVALVRRCLEKKSGDRPTNASALRAELRVIEERLELRWSLARAQALWATLPAASAEIERTVRLPHQLIVREG